jgi:peptidyl-dipeptidase Dcp
MYWVAGEMFNMNFIPMQGVQVFHPDVKVWEVRNKTTGKHIGLWYFDPYARKGKRSGAWMTEYRNQEKFNGEIPTIVSNNSNFIKGREGEPVLISWEDATTLFHACASRTCKRCQLSDACRYKCGAGLCRISVADS